MTSLGRKQCSNAAKSRAFNHSIVAQRKLNGCKTFKLTTHAYGLTIHDCIDTGSIFFMEVDNGNYEFMNQEATT